MTFLLGLQGFSFHLYLYWSLYLTARIFEVQRSKIGTAVQTETEKHQPLTDWNILDTLRWELEMSSHISAFRCISE